MKTRSRSIVVLVVLLVGVTFARCTLRTAGTPKEELQRRGVAIEALDDGAVRVSLRGKELTVTDLSAVLALCSNHADEYSELRELDLSRTNVSDDELRYLELNSTGLSALRTLDLSEARVSDAAVAALQAALPGCQIVR